MPPGAYEYDAATAVRYDAAVPLQPGEVDFYLGLARDAEARGLRTLEPVCGTGRIATLLAREGIRIVGVDLSPHMLARARENSAGLDNVEWREGGVRVSGPRLHLAGAKTGTANRELGAAHPGAGDADRALHLPPWCAAVYDRRRLA